MKTQVNTPIKVNDQGQVEINLAPDDANEDWVRSSRLLKAAMAGDETARKQLRGLESSPTLEEVASE